jgi:hypothetical protein
MKNPYSQSLTIVGLGVGVALPSFFIAICVACFFYVSGKIGEGERLLDRKKTAQSQLEETNLAIRRFDQFATLTAKIAPASNIRTEFRDTLTQLESSGFTPAKFEALSSFSGTAPFKDIAVFAPEQIELNIKTRFVYLCQAIDVIETLNPQIFLRSLSLRTDTPQPFALSVQNPVIPRTEIPRTEQPLLAQLNYIVVNLPSLPQ